MPGTFSNLTAHVWLSIPLLHGRTPAACVPGKLAAIDQYFGSKCVDRLNLTHDKTLVQGDVLIDDKGIITGAATPIWQHRIHDRSHNKSVTGAPTMADWREWHGHVYPLPERVPV